MFAWSFPFTNIGYGAFVGSQSMAGFNSISSTPSVDLEWRQALVSMSRQLVISSPSASAVIDRFTAGIVGSGISYQPPEETAILTDYRYSDMVSYISREFALASHTNGLDAQGDMDFAMMQELACRNWMLSGDIFFIRRVRNGVSSWRAIESDRVQTPYYYSTKEGVGIVCYNPETGNRIIDGVELDSDGIPCAYWVLKDYIDAPLLVQEGQIERIPAFLEDGEPLVLHIFKRLRPDQYRGVPILSGLLETLHSRRNYTQAELQAAALQAAVFGFISSQNPTFDETEALPQRDLDKPIPVAPATKDTPPETPVMQLDTQYKEACDTNAWYDKVFPRPKAVSAGQVVHLADGEEIKFLQSTHPNQNYGSFIGATDKDIAQGVGIPLKALEATYDGSYSSCKAAVQQAAEVYKNYRSYFIKKFIKPIFQIFCREKLEGLVDDPLFVATALSLESQWKQPQAIILDAKVELESYKLAIEMGLIDRDEAAMNIFGHKASGKVEVPNETVEVDRI